MKKGLKFCRWGVILLACACLGACASVPFDYPRTPSTAIPPSHQTRLWKGLDAHPEFREGRSGFFLIPSGMDAFLSRYFLIEAADRSLDLQYFMFHDDSTGLLLMERLLAAADRGVRVRLLFDDWNVAGRDFPLSMVSSHPNIKVRIFNPFSGDRSTDLSRFLESIAGERRLQRRMHNKVFVADNIAAIVGGRNLGNEYFDASSSFNFSDLDIIMVGKITHQVSAAFDEYWNSELAVPIEAFMSGSPGADDLRKAKRRLQANRERTKGSEYDKATRDSDLLARLLAGNVPFVWTEGMFFWDRPVKVQSSPAKTKDPAVSLAPLLHSFARGARSEVLMMSPYLVPGPAGLQRMREQLERGVKVKILTNSLASNDVKAAHGGYARYRMEMLRLGVELYEMKPTAGDSPRERRERISGSSRGALHAKTYVLDRELVFVGSYNLDSRSRTLNTEGGIGIKSPEIAAQAARLFELRTAPERSYRVTLRRDPPEAKGDEPGEARLSWVTEEDGRTVSYDEEPMTGFWDRLSVKIMSWFVPEEVL